MQKQFFHFYKKLAEYCKQIISELCIAAIIKKEYRDLYIDNISFTKTFDKK